ncbi:uncharacterized protein LOC115449156 isoform X1 [Manduca sexta]|uniref:uncharacterized protein LOC115449156 isoform X1 n=1 Tax=Manduca sexta TaxID=7130 RepID=UPI00188E28D2|nr:uncharacterized protein LOC115449156 isoform X1 [Manduca sexta]
MFYDNIIMNSETLGKVWKVANNIEDSNNDISLPKICEQLDDWLGNEEEVPYKRLSLRTSAMFIDGAAKLYKQGMQKLFEDIDSLDKAMSSRKRRRDVPDYSTSSTSTSDTVPTPEKMMRRHPYDVGIDTSQINGTRWRSYEDRSPSICSNKTVERWTFRGTNNNIFIRDDNRTSSVVTSEDSDEIQEVQRKEQEVQTTLSFAPNVERANAQTNGFDENLPFGYVIIHDNYRSRIPSKIIFSSLNADVKNIF